MMLRSSFCTPILLALKAASTSLTASSILSTAVVAVYVLGGSACSRESSGPAEERLVEIVFTAMPLRRQDITYIAPLGGLNPPGHTIPNDHIGLYVVDRCPCDLSPRPVYAPANGTVRVIRRDRDDGIEIGEPPDVAGSEKQPWYYMGHVILRPEIQVGGRVTAGQEIGTTSPYAFGLDLGLVHPRARNYFVKRARYTDKALYGEKPLRFFAEPLRSELYALVRRSGPDKDGKFDYDVAGRLVGGWFQDGVPLDYRSTGPEGWERTLAFVYSEWDPAIPHVVAGGTILQPIVWWIDPGDADFRQVSVATGIVRYRLSISPPSPTRSADRVLLVQLVSDERLMVEAFPSAAQPTAFTANAMVYLR
jgi:hypothetical protein